MEEKIKKLEYKVEKLENDRKIVGVLLGLLLVAVIILLFKTT